MRNRLFDHLEVNLLHVNLLVELRRELCALQELCIDAERHGDGVVLLTFLRR